MTAHPPDTAAADPRRWWALGFALTGNLAVFAAVTMMNVALPSLQDELGMSADAGQWVVTLYSLCFGSFMLLGGKLADIAGVRRCLCAGLLGFGAASLLGGAATAPAVLLAARALQGASGALVAATALAAVSTLFAPGPARDRAFAAFGIVMGLGTAASFAVAGALVEWASWRWCLLVNVPLALVLAVGVTRTAPPAAAGGRARIDLFGAVLVTGALGLTVTGFERSSALGWGHGAVWAPLAGGVVLAALFAAALRRSPHPLVPPRLLADRERGGAFLAVFAVGVGMFAGMFLLTAFLLDVLGYSALAAGAAFLPFGLGAVAGSRVQAAMTARMPNGPVLATGLALAAAALATLTLLTPSSGYVAGVLPAMVLLGVGGTIVMVTGSDAATLRAGADSGVAGAVVNASQQVGAALGTALLASILAAGARDGGARGPEALLAGYDEAGAAGTAILAAGAAAVLLTCPPRRRHRLEREARARVAPR